MDSFVQRDGKWLRRGYTTGSCAAAAAKASAMMLLGGGRMESVWLLTPAGVGLTLPLSEIQVDGEGVSCGVVKDSGDDPDVTNGITIFARVERFDAPGPLVEIQGGEGIGLVTRPGLDQPVGEAAINSVPRRMIREELLAVMEERGFTGGLRVTLWAPGGENLAQKTFNPRLGIVGGISILGTTGIVEPMSDEAVVETIRAEVSMRRASGQKDLLFTPGNYGADYLKNALKLDPQRVVTVSNFVGDALNIAAEAGAESFLLVGHIGKLVKLAGGIFNTHSRYGDCRGEIFAAHAALCGASRTVVQGLMESVMTDGMLDILETAGLREPVMESIIDKIAFHLSQKAAGRLQAEAMVFSQKAGLLGVTPGALDLLERIR